jgi:hypothetical protein
VQSSMSTFDNACQHFAGVTKRRRYGPWCFVALEHGTMALLLRPESVVMCERDIPVMHTILKGNSPLALSLCLSVSLPPSLPPSLPLSFSTPLLLPPSQALHQGTQPRQGSTRNGQVQSRGVRGRGSTPDRDQLLHDGTNGSKGKSLLPGRGLNSLQVDCTTGNHWNATDKDKRPISVPCQKSLHRKTNRFSSKSGHLWGRIVN